MRIMRENRTEPRAGTWLQVEILWEDEAGNPHVAPAKLEDTSRSGAGIRAKQQIAAGQKIIVAGAQTLHENDEVRVVE